MKEDCCLVCFHPKPISEFVKSSRDKRGYVRVCLDCEKKRSRIKHSKAPERHIWRCMIKRCYDPRSPTYQGYGSRGITVADEWRGPEGFTRFLHHVGPRPSALHSLDRYPDNNGNYEPGNVRWATDKEQNRNRGSYNTLLTLGGETKTLAAWSESTGFSPSVISQRISLHKWSVERALTEPLHPNGKKKSPHEH